MAMKKALRTCGLSAALGTLVLAGLAAAQHAPAEIHLFRFHTGFWVNLHHFLYVLGRAQNAAPDSHRAGVQAAPSEASRAIAAQPEATRTRWQNAVDAYAGSLSQKDAVFDHDLGRLVLQLTKASDEARLDRLGLDSATAHTLESSAEIYRSLWWANHREADAAAISRFETLLARHGEAVAALITKAYGQPWPTTGVPVEVSGYSNWAGAYSTDGPLLVVSSKDEALHQVGGLEILFHEAMHQWDPEIEQRLSRVGAKVGKTVPANLSHALIFYTAGDAVQQVVGSDYVPYAIENGVWGRGMSTLKPVLDEHWRPYLHGSGDFDSAIAKILQSLPKS
jgi:hypothetical protein